jgi:hypothetical protein
MPLAKRDYRFGLKSPARLSPSNRPAPSLPELRRARFANIKLASITSQPFSPSTRQSDRKQIETRTRLSSHQLMQRHFSLIERFCPL